MPDFCYFDYILAQILALRLFKEIGGNNRAQGRVCGGLWREPREMEKLKEKKKVRQHPVNYIIM